MASTHNLLGLVSQLQNLEISFSKILMETAMKLSALTDLNVFVLVETQDGRRFSGKRHLCDAYIDGSLTGRRNDVEFEINPSVFALRQRPHRRAAPSSSRPSSQRRNHHLRHRDSGRGRGGGSDSTQRRTPKRIADFSTLNTQSSPTLVKRRRIGPPETDERTLETAELSGGKDEDDVDDDDDEDDHHRGRREKLLNSSGETSTTSSSSLHMDAATVESRFMMVDPMESTTVTDTVEAEELGEPDDGQLDEQTGEMRASAIMPFNGVDDSLQLNFHSPESGASRFDVTASSLVGANPHALSTSPASPRAARRALDRSDKLSSLFDFDLEDCEELNRQLMESLPHTLVSKLEGLSQFQSGPNLIPGSTEFRLLNSILYEFGIHTRSFCPFDTALPAAKKFLYNNLDSLITLFPILDAIVHHGGKFPIGSRQITKLTYFREKTKKAFMKYVKTGPALFGAAKEQANNAVGGKDVAVVVDKNVFNADQPQTHFVHHRLELQEF